MIELDLDELVDNNTSWWCGKLATEMTYRQLFPKSYAIDCIPILMIGLTLSPIAFMVGLAQREEDFSDQIYEK